MTINHLNDNNNLNVYFHMKNHYKKLRNVKSVVDTSAPQGFMKSAATPPNSDRSWKTCSNEERHAKDCSHIPNHSNYVKRHDCVTADTKSNATARSVSTPPPRPKTRRHPYEMPCKSQWKSRSQSVGVTSRKDVSINPTNNRARKKRQMVRYQGTIQESENKVPVKDGVIVQEDVLSDETNRSNSSRNTVSCKSEKSMKSRTEEHEYLQFLLRITEDIIINNFYTSEDVEKVFRNHVEANRDRLKMEKMEAQLDRLCKELHIPYKYGENGTKHGECYPNFFNNNQHISRFSQHLADCECGTNRVLEVNGKENKKTNTVFNDDSLENCLELNNNTYRNSSTYLLNKHSLGRVTECTEPTNSIDTLNSMKHASITTVSSFDNGVLPCFEYLDVDGWEEKKYLGNEVPKDEAETIDKELPLTNKEKIECVEEKIFFDKCTSPSLEQNTLKESTNDNQKQTSNKYVDKALDIQNMEYKVDEKNTLNKTQLEFSNTLIGDYIGNTHTMKENSLIGSHNINHTVNLILTKLNTNVQGCIEITPAPAVDEKKSTLDESTQIEVSQCDKECNTDQRLDEYSIREDYILINGPVYILKSVLDIKENIILHDEPLVETKVEKKLFNDKTFPFNALCSLDYNSEPMYRRQSHFSKLLNSDYDLTPQRDDNTSDKYHHLLVDASTSITILGTTKVAVPSLKPDALLLSENYSFNNKKENKEDEKESDEQNENSYIFSTNELSSDGQYEIKSYTIPKQVNGCVQLCGYSIDSHSEGDVRIREQMTELDVSLSAYEIKSHSDVGESANGAGGKGDVGESGVSTADEENSQASTVRSEKSQNSATSATCAKNILGKRKLNHPS